MYDAWEEAALEATVEAVEEDPHLTEYEAWEEVALAATVDAFVADERQQQEAERRHREAVRRQWTVELRQQWWEELALLREVWEEHQREDEVYERRRLAEMQLRLRRQVVEHRRRQEELEQQLRQEAVAADRSAYLMFVAERAAGINDG
jgi:hypothetical protein